MTGYALMAATTLAAVVWMAGLVYYDVAQQRRGAGWAALALVTAFAILWGALPAWPAAYLCTLALWAGSLAWWWTLKPSHRRDWSPAVAVLPRAERIGDRVTVLNLRSACYGPGGEAFMRHVTRRVSLARLQGADLILCSWGSTWICHPLVVFDFGVDGRICFSVEVRYRRGQSYAWLPTLYRQQEMIYVACDERDAVEQRVFAEVEETCRMFRLVAEPDELREMFLEYVQHMNEIFEQPRWYHGLTANCTTAIYRQRQGRIDWDWRWLLNGRMDEALYERGRFDDRFSLEHLQRTSEINDIARRAAKLSLT
ncbi:MAG: DUF4105 domain-containing protein, partial [Planctomycetales bacterium]|nr:DUF4105 domain-containing protein [Planctomycetales bacterium]